MKADLAESREKHSHESRRRDNRDVRVFLQAEQVMVAADDIVHRSLNSSFEDAIVVGIAFDHVDDSSRRYDPDLVTNVVQEFGHLFLVPCEVRPETIRHQFPLQFVD